MSESPSEQMRVVTIGGGTGSSVLLTGLNEHTDRLHISAIVTTFDDGGSSGKLRQQFGIPALGDIRRCIAALIPEGPNRQDLRDEFEFRFEHATHLEGDAFGNLLLLFAIEKHGSLSKAINEIASALRLNGHVMPASEEPSNLSAKLKDGSIINGETNIDNHTDTPSVIDRVYLEPPVPANPEALDAIRFAQAIILGPGDLFTSVIPNLLPTGMAEAIQSSKAEIIQVCNISPRKGQTNSLSASDFPKTIDRHISPDETLQPNKRTVDTIIVNAPFQTSSEPQIQIDDALNGMVNRVLVEDVADPENPTRHDPHKLAATLVSYLGTTAINNQRIVAVRSS